MIKRRRHSITKIFLLYLKKFLHPDLSLLVTCDPVANSLLLEIGLHLDFIQSFMNFYFLFYYPFKILVFSEFSSTSSSSLLSLDYPLNTDEPKILTCNQDSSHDVWTHMFDHLLLTGHASSCPGHRVCYSCCLGPIPYSLNLLNTTHHSVWKSFTLRNFSDTSNALSCILLSAYTPYLGLQDTPPSVYTYG